MAICMKKKNNLPQHVLNSVYSGPDLSGMDLVGWRTKPLDKLTRGEKVVRFATDYLVTPEGIKVGQPLELEPFQIAFLLAVFDNPAKTRRAMMSVSRRNGKTFLVAVIMLAFIIGPEAVQNSTLGSGANSRDQSALVFNLMSKMLDLSPKVAGTYRVVPSSKRIIGLKKNVEYMALSADARTGHGKSLLVVLLDEAGQIRGSSSDFVDMLVSSQGSYADPLFLTISTQAPSDADLLSTWIDAAKRDKDPRVVCHVYAADPDAELMDESQWIKANPGLGVFRSVEDLREQLEQASRLPSMENGARNLLLNQRISQDALYISPSVWKQNAKLPDLDVFRTHRVALGLDLSSRHDLTAAVLAAVDDDGDLHLHPFVFAPEDGMRERENRDKAPYTAWVRSGHLIAVPGPVVEYSWVAEWVRDTLHDMKIEVDAIAFDRWRVDIFQAACESANFHPGEWKEVGQGYRDMSIRLESFTTQLLKHKVRHGFHPLLTMASMNAVVVRDPTNAIKIEKSKSTQRVDPLIAAVMAAFEVSDGLGEDRTSYLDGDGAGILFI